MTVRRTKSKQRVGPAARAVDTAGTPLQVEQPPQLAKADQVVQPGPWDAPWHRKEDSVGWETVYRGSGRRRPVKSIVELELTPDQNEWIDGAAEAAGLTLHQFLCALIDTARAAADSASANGAADPGEGRPPGMHGQLTSASVAGSVSTPRK